MQRKKLLYIIPLCLIVGILIYLYFSYTHVYSNFDKTTNPNMVLNYTIGDKQSKQIIRYAALGDSLTAGVGASKIENSFPYLLSEKIAGKNQVKLFDLGQPGATSADLLQQQIIPLTSFTPDLITLCIGTNDIHQGITADTFKTNYNQILDELLKYKQAKIILINIPYLGSDSLVRPPWRSYYDSHIKKYNQVITKIANDHQLTLVNLYDKTKVYFKNNQSQVYSADLYHPNDAGYAYWTDIIYASYH